MPSGIVSAVGSVVSGVMGSKSSSKAARASSDATQAQSQASAEALAFEKERYTDWNNVYGPLQDNLSEYYQSVTPDYYAAIGLEAFEQEFDTKMQNIDEMYAQRGIDPSSGIAASIEAQAELGAAEERAEIRRDAPRMAAEDKSRFLQIGLGQNPASSVSNAMANRTQVAGMQAGIAATEASRASSAAGAAWGAAIPTVGKAIDEYWPKGGTWSGTTANQGGEV